MDIAALKSLRSRTGLPLGQCREALLVGGDFQGALAWLRERGLFEEPPLEGHRLREALAQDDHVRIAEWLAGEKRDHEALVKALRVACDKAAIENVRLLIAAGAASTQRAVASPRFGFLTDRRRPQNRVRESAGWAVWPPRAFERPKVAGAVQI